MNGLGLRSGLRSTLAIVVAASIVATACTSGGDEVADTTTTQSPTTTSTTTQQAPDTRSATTSTALPALTSSIEWTECGAMECGVVDVPLDYDDPDGDTVPIVVNMLRAADTDRSRGALLVNPGGPGGSGTNFAEQFSFGAFPSEITDNFDIVGFDPRGVGDSGPEFECGESGEQLELLAPVVDLIDEPAEVTAVEAAVQLCTESMGNAAGRFGTDYVARDMDEIRKALGEEQISFLGFSYGSVIGVWYATLFPDRVRAMVIDGADNPVDELDTAEQRLESAREEVTPIEDLLREAIEACSDPTCPIFNGGDPEGYYFDAVPKLELVNAAMANNPDAGFLGLITPLYSEASWPALWEALADLQERDDPQAFVNLAEFQLGDDPGAANFTAHVNCLDSWALQPSIDRDVRQQSDAEFFELEDQLIAEFPLIGAIEDSSTPTCVFYDLINPPPLDVPFDGGDVPILVIGNRSDPVTSFGESEELVDDTLSNGILVEVDHPDHTVYPSNECVNELVHDVLLDLTFPDSGVTCDRGDVGLDGGDTESILYEACVEIATSDAPGIDDETLDELCTAFVDDAVARLGTEAIENALFADDPVDGNALIEILFEKLDEFIV